MKAICRNCHFLTKETRNPDTGDRIVFSLKKEEREKVGSDPAEAVESYYSLNCHMGVWDEGVSGSPVERDAIINHTRRGTDCFFFPHLPAMLFGAAKELQKREAEMKRMERSNKYTRIGLYVAAGALLLNAAVAYLKI